ncbi:MAG: hypothetical protein KC486_25345 [Myxococcales bacterium]|nr:hypothetical protein [Myxococcales bacterium]
MTAPSSADPVRQSDVARGWWPLALSWMLMGAELPLMSAVVARLAEPEIHLAAYGGLVFPIALLVEAPIIMMLTASTALSKHRAAYDALRRTNHRLGAALTIVHVAFAFTPLFDRVLVPLLDTPDAVVEPARLGLMLMTPWTWAIASRRFNQGVLIRFGRPRQVTMGSIARLLTGALVLTIGYTAGAPGIVVATSTVIAGVLAEAAYAAIKTLPVVREQMEPGDPATVLRGRPFLRFYVPLALTPLVTLLVQPIGAAALSRMPRAIESLALWPVVSGLLFLFQAAGFALNEVVIALIERRGAPATLRRFAGLLAAALTVVILLFAATPLGVLWFDGVSGLRPELALLAAGVMWFGAPIPGARAIASWYGGVLVASDRTRALTESVVVFLVICAGILAFGIADGSRPGIVVGIFAFAVARLAETAWLAWRSRDLRAALLRRDASDT